MTIVDKPHSLYVGIIMEQVLLDLLAFLGIIVTIAWAALKDQFSLSINYLISLLYYALHGSHF